MWRALLVMAIASACGASSIRVRRATYVAPPDPVFDAAVRAASGTIYGVDAVDRAHRTFATKWFARAHFTYRGVELERAGWLVEVRATGDGHSVVSVSERAQRCATCRDKEPASWVDVPLPSDRDSLARSVRDDLEDGADHLTHAIHAYASKL